MPWKESYVMDEKVKFIAMLLSRSDMSMSCVCASFGISRKTGYKWLRRYQAGEVQALAERSRAPHGNARAISPAIRLALMDARQRFPYWGPKKLRFFLMSQQPEQLWPAASTIGDLHMSYANQVWCADFKGPLYGKAGRGFEPLTISDGFSRYLLDCRLTLHDSAHVWPRFELLFRAYGLPEAIRSDNGPPFASMGLLGLTPLAIKLVKLGIKLERSRPGHPEENGRHERMHRSLSEYMQSQPPAANESVMQRQLDAFTHEYNTLRSHESLGNRTPHACYNGSGRVYPERLPAPQYPAHCAVRSVKHNGQVHFKGKFIYVSESLAKEKIGIDQTEQGDYIAYFYNLALGKIDPSKGKFTRFTPQA